MASGSKSGCKASFYYKLGDMVANPFEGDGVEVNKAAGRISDFNHTVHNGRNDEQLVCTSGRGLDTRGISLQRHVSTFRSYKDDAAIRTHYYPELIAEARRLTGADKATVASHVKRRVDAPGSETKAEAGVRGGAFMVHGDFNNDLKDDLVKMLAEGKPCTAGTGGLELSEKELQEGRLVVLNFWKPMNAEPVKRAPMAVCDASSMSKEEMQTYSHDPKPPPQNYMLPLPNLATLSTTALEHRWFSFPDMTNEEWMVFKTYDSAGPQPSNGVGVHSAFNDPSTQPDDPSRESIEARVVCFIKATAGPETEDSAKRQKH